MPVPIHLQAVSPFAHLLAHLARPGRVAIAGAPPGHDARILGAIAAASGGPVLFIARDDVRMARMAEALRFFHPGVLQIEIPAWDCLPYDRISPRPEIASRRIESLIRLASPPAAPQPQVILTTVTAALQRLPPRDSWAGTSLTLRQGGHLDFAALMRFLEANGYSRTETVTEPGDFAVRGGIVDLFPTGQPAPLRIDLFGDEIESLRRFDPTSQRTTASIEAEDLKPVSEVRLDTASIARFRRGYRQLVGAIAADDPLYLAVSEGRRHPGLEHWLPLFYDRLDTIFEYLPPDAPVILDHQADEIGRSRLADIADYYQARTSIDAGRFGGTAVPYHPVPPERMYLDEAGWLAALVGRGVGALSPFAAPAGGAPGAGQERLPVWDGGGRPGRDFAEARKQPDVNVFDQVIGRIREHHQAERRVMIAAVSRGSRERLAALLHEHGLPPVQPIDSGAEGEAAAAATVTAAVLPLERGFIAPDLAVITEEDILGDRLIRRSARKVKPEAFLAEATALSSGDLVVHVDHGVGRYEGLETVTVGGAAHDCLRVVYAGGDKLYLPVENIEMLSRYGAESEGVVLDKLGGAAWQGRKARLKQRIRAIAHELIALAAARSLRNAAPLSPPHGAFDEFCARFPYEETEDQARAIDDVLSDLAAGRPTDRLICGDVGFGKTEVALRAAFVVAMEGRQTAVVVPTTLLCRQHFRTFSDRFSTFPVRIAEISRLSTAAQVKAAKEGLARGTIDIVIGTHALLAKDIRFRDLGLLIIDEEQHFGVIHKERLKKLKTDVHVLTLTATPIPRTLQMALAGVKEMSLITTPPVDRLAVRTFVLEMDPVVIREAILRERARGGQVFYVCPRIEDQDALQAMLAELVPEVTVVRAHGRMAARDLEAAIGAFYEGQYTVLLSTNIIESGLDLPSCNTLIIHRADMFGLSQLYQLRGRVGRGKLRAFAYFTLPSKKKLTPAAEKRLSVMQALDALGAGFTLASHDLDIRGAGNLLGEEQSGHIREVGIELYQQMLEEAVADARGGDGAVEHDEWSPQISIGVNVLIPETYVADLSLRLGLYRRLADIGTREEIDAFAAELIDRFGPLPDEVNNLLEVVAIKRFCREAGVEKIDAGPKGAVVAFRNNIFANPEALIRFISKQAGTCKVRPDQKLVYYRSWETPKERLAGIRKLTSDLAKLARG